MHFPRDIYILDKYIYYYCIKTSLLDNFALNSFQFNAWHKQLREGCKKSLNFGFFREHLGLSLRCDQCKFQCGDHGARSRPGMADWHTTRVADNSTLNCERHK